MTSRQGLRATAFIAASSAALIGLIWRIAIASSGTDAATFVGVEALVLEPGQSFGQGVFEGAVHEDDIAGLKLKTPSCKDSLYAVPIELKSVAIADLTDRAYLSRPGYGTINVYHERIRRTFSHLERVLARNPFTPYNVDYFIRFYVPADCAIDDRDFVDWAERILALAIRPAASRAIR